MTKEEVLDISKVKFVIDNVFDVINGMIKTFGDGFQITDMIDVPGIAKDFYDIVTVIDEAKAEAKDLSYAEIDEIIKSYGERTIEMIWSSTSHNKYDTRALDEIINLCFESYLLVLEKSKDGIDIDDVKAIPELGANILRIITASHSAYKELNDLSAKELYNLGVNISSRVLLLVKA